VAGRGEIESGWVDLGKYNVMRKVEADIHIHVSPQNIIEAFVNPHMLHAWWGVERSFIEAEIGGVYVLLWGISSAGIKYTSAGIITSYNPVSHLHVHKYMYINPERPILGPQVLTVDVAPVENGSLLHLTQGPYPENAGPDWEWYYTAVVHAWPEVLTGLKKYLEKS
jgi:uncharacterized protein YndB with AHSA1/START domain